MSDGNSRLHDFRTGGCLESGVSYLPLPRRTETQPVTERLGVWLVGALGGIGTTLVVGTRAIARGLVSTAGLVTLRPEFEALGLTPLDAIEFGGHDVRKADYWQSAYQISKGSGSLDLELIQQLKPDLAACSQRLRPGTIANCGEAIADLVSDDAAARPATLRQEIARIRADLAAFRQAHGLRHVVVVNLASTEPDIALGGAAADADGLELLLDRDERERVRPSLLYAYAAFSEGCAYLNFTPSTAALGPGVREFGRRRGLPFMGNDGKTGETLVKSALAPMFKYRHLRVLSWQGYNILGDRDGQILAHKDNLASKLRTKDAVLQSILGYPLHTHVGIDYVPSLDDRKTAWDFIHFEGFLDHRMSMQFVWQGCDSILAAPLVLDMVRLAGMALRHGEAGPMTQLACYFKSPLGVTEHDLHRQFHALTDYLQEHGARTT